MNVHELPMILFTVIAQLCVGTFVVLGVVQLLAARRHDRATVERLTDPVVYAIGPALVFGLAVSMLHMNDVLNVLNVFRHWNSSWLSREIILGIAFAGLGFAFALMQWFRIGSYPLRRVVAGLTAVAGLSLVWAMSQIYYSLEAVPAWHTPIVPFHFFATTLMLGSLTVGAVLMGTGAVRRRAERRAAEDSDDDAPAGDPSDTSGTGLGMPADDVAAAPGGGAATALMTAVRTRTREINAPTSDPEWRLTARTVQWLALTAAVVGVAILGSYALHISSLAGDPVGAGSAEVFSGGFFVARLVLLGLSTVVLGVFSFRTAAEGDRSTAVRLTVLIVAALVLAFASELMGRSLHYDSMLRVGI